MDAKSRELLEALALQFGTIMQSASSIKEATEHPMLINFADVIARYCRLALDEIRYLQEEDPLCK